MKDWKFKIGLIVLIIAIIYVFIPNKIIIEERLTVLYNLYKTKELLITKELKIGADSSFFLYKSPMPNVFLYKRRRLKASSINWVRIHIQDNPKENIDDISRSRQKVSLSLITLSTWWSKLWAWFNYVEVLSNFQHFTASIQSKMNDSKYYYGLRAKVKPVEDTISYLREYKFKEKDKLEKIIAKTFNQSKRFAEQHQAFPGSYAFSIVKKEGSTATGLLYAWMTNVSIKHAYPYERRRIPSNGIMYITDKIETSYDSLYYYQQNIFDLATSRGYINVATPFSKIYNIKSEQGKLIIKLYSPIK